MSETIDISEPTNQLGKNKDANTHQEVMCLNCSVNKTWLRKIGDSNTSKSKLQPWWTRWTRVNVNPPKYTRAPGFQFDLSALCDNKQNLTLNVANTHTYDDVEKKINGYSRLDESQAKALIFALMREIALIEGPPGTGKTVVGIEIMKVLLAENNRANIGPISPFVLLIMLLTSSWRILRDFYNKFSNITHIDLPSWVLGVNIIEEIDEDSETEDLQESCDEEFDDEEIDDEETDDEETDDKGFQDSNKEKNEESQNKFIKVQGRKMHEFEKWLIGKILKRSKREKIIKDCSIWKMSKKEIQKLHDYWRAKLDEERLLNLQTKHEGCHQELNDIYDGTPSNIIK
ncbi:unnamed protein product [Rhizophagus irregularis]|nr:unnamed protein product [Rhizophagus irregularis]